MSNPIETWSTRKKVIIGAILVCIFLLGTLVIYSALSKQEKAPETVATETNPFGTGAQDLVMNPETGEMVSTNVLLGSGPETEFSATLSSDKKTVAINWSSPGATSCIAGGDARAWFFTGNSVAGTTSTNAPEGDTTYTIQCTNKEGGLTIRTALVSIPLSSAIASTASNLYNYITGSNTSTGGSTSGGSASEVTVGSAPAPTIMFRAYPSSVIKGNTTRLSWSASRATGCTASGAWSGAKGISGGETSPAVKDGTNVFTLSCTGANGTTRANVTVTGTTGSPTLTVTANPSTIDSGDISTISWISTNTTSCATDAGTWSAPSNTLPVQGSLASAPLINTIQTQAAKSVTFGIACTGPKGIVKKSVVVKVNKSDLPEIRFTANPSRVNIAQTNQVTLTWSVTKATSCTALGGWSGTKSLSGSEVVTARTLNPDFRLSCEGEGGKIERQVTLIAYLPPPSISISVSGLSLRCAGNYYAAPGTPFHISWDTNQDAICRTSGGSALSGWDDKSVSGHESKNIIFGDLWNDTYTVTCDSGGGSSSKSVTIRNAARFAGECLADKLGL